MAPNMAVDLPALQLGSTAQLALGVLALSLAVQLLEVALQRLKVGRPTLCWWGPGQLPTHTNALPCPCAGAGRLGTTSRSYKCPRPPPPRQVPDTAARQAALGREVAHLKRQAALLNTPETFAACAKAERKAIALERQLAQLQEQQVRVFLWVGLAGVDGRTTVGWGCRLGRRGGPAAQQSVLLQFPHQVLT